MTNNSWEEVAPLLKEVLTKGSVSEKDRTVLLGTLSSKRHIQLDNIREAQKDLMEAKEALIETDTLVNRVKKLEVV